jgi:hypothetical protein
MKHTLFAIALISFVSCGKQPACPPVNPPVPPKINSGCWVGNNGAFICFTDSLFSKTNQFFTPYAITDDSVYFLFNNTVRVADFGYEFKNDTLIVYPVNPYPNAPFKYWR